MQVLPFRMGSRPIDQMIPKENYLKRHWHKVTCVCVCVCVTVRVWCCRSILPPCCSSFFVYSLIIYGMILLQRESPRGQSADIVGFSNTNRTKSRIQLTRYHCIEQTREESMIY